jgi:hypothetical protein
MNKLLVFSGVFQVLATPIRIWRAKTQYGLLSSKITSEAVKSQDPRLAKTLGQIKSKKTGSFQWELGSMSKLSTRHQRRRLWPEFLYGTVHVDDAGTSSLTASSANA